MMLLIQTTLELGLISSLTVLALFLSYSMLNVCDLSTDGCFTLGAAVGAMVALSGHPILAVFAAMFAGVISGFVVSILQTKMGIDSLLSGIVVNTGLYSVNIAIMGDSSQVNLNKVKTVFTMMRSLFDKEGNTALGIWLDWYKTLTVLFFVIIVILFLAFFLRTRLGLAIRATGNNSAMVKASSINPAFTTITGLCVANAITGLSGCLMAQYQKSANIDIGGGMVTIALASLLIGGVFMSRGKIAKRAVGAVIGAVLFRLVYTIALRFNMPASMLKLVSSVIVVIAIFGPYMRSRYPMFMRKLELKKGYAGERRDENA
ncbi:MAG: ABC transporter permease [Lachnospiraceae bacterium]|nr:ABC transporter permease [Lachnospiraceae bacterium]